MQLQSEEEVEEVIRCFQDLSHVLPSNPFTVMDKWMEVIGSPPRSCWVKFSGVPLHAWKEGVFRLLGNCLGETTEVDQRTVSKEVLTHGRAKIQLGRVWKLPAQITLWLGDLQIWVVAEEDQEPTNQLQLADPAYPVPEVKMTRAMSKVQLEEGQDSGGDISTRISNFKRPASGSCRAPRRKVGWGSDH